MKATAVPGSVMVASSETASGITFVTVDGATDYAAYAALPAGIEFDGIVLGKSGWNSDRGVCYYRSDRRFGKAVA